MVIQHLSPGDIPIASDDGMRAPKLARLVRKQRRVKTAVDNGCARGARGTPDFVAPERVAGMHTDANDVSRTDLGDVDALERLINENRIAEFSRCCRGENEKPSRRDDSYPKRNVARID